MKKLNITITSPTLDDIDTLYQWGENNWQLWANNRSKWFTKKSLALWLSDPKEDILLVAKDNNKMVGMATTYILRDWAFCVGLYVEKNYRQLGIGKNLLDETIDRLIKKGVYTISLMCDEKNIDGLKFYKKFKFYKGFKFYWMEKMLKEAP